MKNLRKILAVVLCAAMLLCCFAGCGKQNENGLTSDQQAAVNSVTGTTGGFGSRMKMVYPDRSYIFGKELNVEWSGLKANETVTLTLEKKNGDKYEKVLEKAGLTGTSYKYEKAMENADYRIKLVSVAKDGTKKDASNTKDAGFEFKNTATSTGASVNTGIDYKFDGSISLNVLNNYLNRTMTYVTFPDDQPWGQKELDADFTYECARGILNTGAKYITRFLCDFTYSKPQEAAHQDIKRWIADVHKVDPDIIFEAGIFERVDKGVEGISVPAWVFEAFGKKPEDRKFELSGMYSQFGANYGGASSHAPDITKEEYQMYVYYRARTYIDLGIESFHMGIVSLVGKNDKDFSAYAKVLGMIRDYAKKNARRHYVLINGHGTQKAVYKGVNLFDFHASPMRIRIAKGETDHAVSENNPQRCDFYPGEKMLYGVDIWQENDAPYLKHIKGTSPSGWTTDNYPYLLEFDNWGVNKTLFNKAIDRFGYDEISWFANQPDWYRREFLQKSIDKLVGLKDNGHLSMPGRRTAYDYAAGEQQDYWMNDAKYAKDGFSDEATIKAIWAKLK